MNVIIDLPNRRSLAQKYGDNSLRIFMVLGWVYLCLPLFTFVAWYVSYTFFDQHLLLLEGYKEYKTSTSLWYVGIIATMVILILAWSKGSQFLAGEKDESAATALSLAESSAYYQVAEDKVLQYRSLKNMTVFFNGDGTIVEVEAQVSPSS